MTRDDAIVAVAALLLAALERADALRAEDLVLDLERLYRCVVDRRGHGDDAVEQVVGGGSFEAQQFIVRGVGEAEA